MSSRLTTSLASGLLIAILVFVHTHPAQAKTTRVVIQPATFVSGYTASVPEATFFVGLPAKSVQTTAAVILKLRKVEQLEQFDFTGETLIGDLYSYHMHSTGVFQVNRKLWLGLSYPQESTRTTIKYWQPHLRRWTRLNTRHHTDQWLASAELKRSHAVVGVFAKKTKVSNSNVVEGTASWYNGTVAASNAFPMGSTIRVTNTATGQSVEVLVGSTWSADTKYGWLLDLPKDSFAAIANISTGLIHVSVEIIAT